MKQPRASYTPAAESTFDEGETLDEISKMVDELTEKIAAKRTLLAPLIKDLRALRGEEREVKVGCGSARKGGGCCCSTRSSLSFLFSLLLLLLLLPPPPLHSGG